VSKTWPNDLRIGCKSPYSLADFVESDFNLKKKLQEFEGAFEREEIVELKILNNFFFKFPCILK
jgi:hypothetical protein